MERTRLESFVRTLDDRGLTELGALVEAERYRRLSRRLSRAVSRPQVLGRGPNDGERVITEHMRKKGWRFIPAARVMGRSPFIGRLGQWVRQCPSCGLERNENYFLIEGRERGNRTPWCDPCLNRRAEPEQLPLPYPGFGD